MTPLRFLRYLPFNTLSYLWGRLAACPLPVGSRKAIYSLYIRATGVETEEIAGHLEDYRSLQEFFVRELPEGLRPIEPDPMTIVSPVDGVVSESGVIKAGSLIQAKGIDYKLRELVRNPQWSERFEGGTYVTFYLRPKDYHRIHSPISGRIVASEKVPGSLLTVMPFAVRGIPDLFSRNERLTTFIQGDRAKVAVVKVGATMVGSVIVTYDSISTNSPTGSYRYTEYKDITIAKGAELGRFQMGSTVVLLIESGRCRLNLPPVGSRITMGKAVAQWQ